MNIFLPSLFAWHLNLFVWLESVIYDCGFNGNFYFCDVASNNSFPSASETRSEIAKSFIQPQPPLKSPPPIPRWVNKFLSSSRKLSSPIEFLVEKLILSSHRASARLFRSNSWKQRVPMAHVFTIRRDRVRKSLSAFRLPAPRGTAAWERCFIAGKFSFLGQRREWDCASGTERGFKVHAASFTLNLK